MPVGLAHVGCIVSTVRRCAALQPMAYGAMRHGHGRTSFRAKSSGLRSRGCVRSSAAALLSAVASAAALKVSAESGGSAVLAHGSAAKPTVTHVLECRLLLPRHARPQPVANHTSERPQRALICLAI